MADLDITPLRASSETQAMLREILIEVVAAGGSVSFMHPLAPAAADAYWDHALGAAARGERVILGAWDGDVLAGTVTLLLDLPQNQPHRAEVAKLMTRPTGTLIFWKSRRPRRPAGSLMNAQREPVEF